MWFGGGKTPFTVLQGLPGGSAVKNLLAMQELQETWVRYLGWEDPLEKEMATTPVFLPGESHGQRSLAGYSPRGCKESDTTEQLSLSLFALIQGLRNTRFKFR